MSRRHPPTRTRFPGLVVSISHSAAGSSPTAPLTVSVTCGLTQRSSTTLPLILTVLEKSNMEAEWCAATWDIPAASTANAANAPIDFMSFRIEELLLVGYFAGTAVV